MKAMAACVCGFDVVDLYVGALSHEDFSDLCRQEVLFLVGALTKQHLNVGTCIGNNEQATVLHQRCCGAQGMCNLHGVLLMDTCRDVYDCEVLHEHGVECGDGIGIDVGQCTVEGRGLRCGG